MISSDTSRMEAFGGPRALHLAQRMPAGLGIVVAEPDQTIRALPAIVDMRKAAQPVLLHFKIEEHLTVLSRHVANQLIAQGDYDQCCDLLDRLSDGSMLVNEAPVTRFVSYMGESVLSMQLAARFSSAIVVQSWREYQRLQDLEVPVRRAVRFVAEDPLIPDVRASGGDAIVVWAPHLNPEDLLLPAIALQELKAPLFIVCARDSFHRKLRAKFVPYSKCQEVLERARIIIDYTADPGTALSLARVGVPMSVPLHGGAFEYLDYATTHTQWNRFSIVQAAQTTMARPPARIRADVPSDAAILRQVFDEEVPRRVEGGPLVSIVMPTYNRREDLPAALAAAEAQTYQNLEIVVSNDGGEPVDDIVARFPRARLLNNEHAGPASNINAGAANARGKYFFVCNDDDVIFPETIASLVEVARPDEREFLHCDSINECQERAAETDAFQRFGYIGCSVSSMDRTAVLIGAPICDGLSLYRKDVWEELGGLDLAKTYTNDHDLLMRASARYEYVRLDKVLYVRSVRYNQSQFGMIDHDANAAFLDLFEHNPVDDRPVLLQKRRDRLEYIRSGAGAQRARPAEVIPGENR